MPLVDWGASTRGQVSRAFADGAIAALAAGALEQHGEHLPTDTDTFLAGRLLEDAAARSAGCVVVLPALPFGFSPYHQRFGGTITLGSATFLAVLSDICSSVRAAGARTLVVINGHGGNEGPLRIASHECSDDEFCVVQTSYWLLAGGATAEVFDRDGGDVGHAGQLETSLTLALRAASVGELDSGFEPIRPPVRPPTHQLLGSTGVIGDPSSARGALGEQYFEIVVDSLARLLDELTRQPLAAQ